MAMLTNKKNISPIEKQQWQNIQTTIAKKQQKWEREITNTKAVLQPQKMFMATKDTLHTKI